MTPIKVRLEKDKEYYYCTCGKGKDGILCDGTHSQTEFVPKAFTVVKTDEYFLCPCKKSSLNPFCDGSHQS